MLKERENIIVSATEPTGKDREKVWLQKSENLVKQTIIIGDLSPTSYGSIPNAIITDNTRATFKDIFLKINSNKNIVVSHSNMFVHAIYECNKNKVIINNPTSYSQSGATIKLNAETKFIAIRIRKEDKTEITNEELNLLKLQIQYGTNVTTYEKYVESKIYVLNNNNNSYEEFVQKQQNDYSTEEQVVGTWIDGKKLYRKVIDIGTLPNTNIKVVAHHIVNLDHFTSVKGIAYSNSKGSMPLPFSNATLGNVVSFSADVENVRIGTGVDRSMYCGYAILEYTKTTD